MKAARVSALLSSVLLILSGFEARAGDTFSIVAVDGYTQQVGSAGASCISGSVIISDVHPGIGVVHTQSYWNQANQNYARSLMNQGYAPQAIIDSLVAHDATGNPSIRQYGIVDLVGGGRSAGFSGSNCIDYKNHLLGPNYAIQGNILLGPQILDAMENRFLITPGSMADKLMAALQGAKVPGADTRCLQYNKSSISAFLRIAKPGDTGGNYYINLNVNNTPNSQDPIDLLQSLYDQWRLQATGIEGDRASGPRGLDLFQNEPNPFIGSTAVGYRLSSPGRTTVRVYDLRGREVATLVDQEQAAGLYMIGWDGAGAESPGIYFCRLQSGVSSATRKMILLSQGGNSELRD